MPGLTSRAEPLALKARYVFPASGKPVADAAVTIHRERIAAVGEVPPGAGVRDLGNVAILPGLVNAHTHLEFSHLAEPLGTPGTRAADWLRAVVALRRERRPEATGAVEAGLRECLLAGTTTLGEIAQPDWSPEPLDRWGLDATVLLELIALTSKRVETALEAARGHLRRRASLKHVRPGLSPHAPYSVRPELLAAAAKLSAETETPLAFHLAEFREELELIRRGTGPLREFLGELGAWDAAAFPPGGRPLDYLRVLSQAHRALVIHGNYLDDEEIAFLAEHADRMAVVYCPRTHAWFRHDAYPLAKMLQAGVAVALGTDSRASAADLSMLAEIRFVARQPGAPPGDVVLQLGTIRAAGALGRGDELGTLEPGKYADLAVVALPDRGAADPYELLLDSDLPVLATWVRGRPGNPSS